MPIRAITIDFWRTLFRDANGEERQSVRAKAFCDETGADQAAVLSALVRSGDAFLQYHIENKKTLRPEDAVEMVARDVGVALTPDQATRLTHVFATAILQHPPVPIDDALEAVQAAAARCPIAVISDAGLSPGSSLKVLLDRNGFTSHFHTLTFSSDVGVAKPHRDMFTTTARALGFDLADLLHVGDLEFTDIIGAHGVGAKAALFAGDNRRYAATTKADYLFTSWRDFIERLPDLV